MHTDHSFSALTTSPSFHQHLAHKSTAPPFPFIKEKASKCQPNKTKQDVIRQDNSPYKHFNIILIGSIKNNNTIIIDYTFL